MSRDEMIKYMAENPSIKITHRLFDSNEFIYQNEDGRIYDENGYLFEDWESEYHNGIRMRTGKSWEHGWEPYSKVTFDN